MTEESPCLLCAGISDPGVSLLDPMQHTLIKFAEINLGLLISEENGISTRVCISCIQSIQDWKKFRDKCKTTHNLLTSRIKHVTTSTPSPVTSHQEVSSITGYSSVEDGNCDVTFTSVSPALQTAKERSVISKTAKNVISQNRTGNQVDVSSKRNSSLKNWLIVQKPKLISDNNIHSNVEQIQEKSIATDLLRKVRVLPEQSRLIINAGLGNTTDNPSRSQDLISSSYNLKELRVNLTRLSDNFIQSLQQVKTEPDIKQETVSSDEDEIVSIISDKNKKRSDVSRSKRMKTGSETDVSNTADKIDDNFHESSEDEKKFSPEEHLVKIEKLSIPNTFVSSRMNPKESSQNLRGQISSIEKMQRVRSALTAELKKRSFGRKSSTKSSSNEPVEATTVQQINVENEDAKKIVPKEESSSNPASPLQEQMSPGPASSQSEHEQGVVQEISNHDLPQSAENVGKNFRSEAFRTKKQQKSQVKSKLCKKNFYCAHCNYACNRKFNIKLHLVSQHRETLENPDEKQSKCYICSKILKTRGNLELHMLSHSNTRSFKCNICSKGFNIKGARDHHMKTVHSTNRPFQCGICSKSFKRKCACDFHIKTVHFNYKPIQCEFCLKMFCSKTSCALHQKRVHTTNNTPFKCEKCPNKSFKTREYLRKHKLSIHSLQVLKYKCEICLKLFKTNSVCKNHKLTVHSNKRPFKCEICSKTFKLQCHCNEHKRLVHSTTKPYQCDSCSMRFKTKCLYKYHKERVHLNIRAYKCDICCKTFKSGQGCKQHKILVHSAVTKMFKCTICSKLYKSHYKCLEHMATIHNNSTKNTKIYDCEHCTKIFLTRTGCEAHMLNIHLRVEPIKCNLCFKLFKTMIRLKAHITNVHNSESVFKCETCDKKFKSKKCLTQHVVIHSDEHPYRCDECGKMFKTKQKLATHLITHRIDRPYECSVCKLCFKRKRCLKVHSLKHDKKNTS